MKKQLLCRIFMVTLLPLSLSSAHELFIHAPSSLAAEEILDASIGYGHFPVRDVLTELQLTEFNPLEVINEKGKVSVQKVKEARYQTEKLKEGGYLLLASSKPYYRTNTTEGLVTVAKNEVDDALNCTQYTLYGKTMLRVGEYVDAQFLTIPHGQRLEFIPQADPTTFKHGSPIKVQLLLEGKPIEALKVVAEHEVEGEVEGSTLTTDRNGMLELTLNLKGAWILLTEYQQKHANPQECDNDVIESSMILNVLE